MCNRLGNSGQIAQCCPKGFIRCHAVTWTVGDLETDRDSMRSTSYMTWTPEHWGALASWVTVGVALLAGLIAWRQVTEARRLRLEQAQPYVVVYMEPSAATPHIIDLVVRNFGATAAYDVTLSVSPDLKRSGQGGTTEPVWMFDSLPVLVPGQEWRTMWDFSPERVQTSLPDRYDVTTSYKDSHGRRLPPMPSVLDWGAHRGRQWATVYGIHDAAKALRDLNATAKRWTDGTRHLAVNVRDGDAQDRRLGEAREERKRAHEELRAKVLPSEGGPSPADEEDEQQ